LITEQDILKEAQIRGHIPVLAQDVLSFLPAQRPLRVLDATYGRGGHARLMALKAEIEIYVAMDRDPRALECARNWQPEFPVVIHDGPFSEMENVVKQKKLGLFDVILLDIGVSSPQIDEAERGFSFQKAGPLDMRMDTRSGDSAADLLQKLSESDIADIIFNYGEERASRKIAKAIVQQRQICPIKDTYSLAHLIEAVMPRTGKIHPATRTFQALRIAVNRELEELEKALEQVPRLLRAHGRALVISFHSLEDRMVKQSIQEWKGQGLGEPAHKKVITASDDEMRRNSRSRSAKMRVFERGEL
jgi:16S rRNA (cytosine1402-N4)-methyltransferase